MSIQVQSNFSSIVIHDQGYFIDSSGKPLSNSCLLKCIEKVLKEGLPYAPDHEDSYSQLAPQEQRNLLRDRARLIRDSSHFKKRFRSIYNRIDQLTYPLLELPSEINLRIMHFLLVEDMKAIACVSHTGRTLANEALKARAQEYGFEGNDAQQPIHYLNHLFKSVVKFKEEACIPNEHVIHSRRKFFLRSNAINPELTLRNIKYMDEAQDFNRTMSRKFVNCLYNDSQVKPLIELGVLKFKRIDMPPIMGKVAMALRIKVNENFIRNFWQISVQRLLEIDLLKEVQACEKDIQQFIEVLRLRKKCFLLFDMALKGKSDVVTLPYLLNRVDPHLLVGKDSPLLGWAIKQRKLAFAKYLIEHGADVNSEDPQGKTPLYHAGQCDDHDFFDFLLQRGADPKVLVKEITILHYEALEGHSKNVESLLLRDADPHFRLMTTGMAPLHWAALNGHGECVELLLQWSSDPDVADARGNTPLCLAMLKPKDKEEPLDNDKEDPVKKTVQELLQKGANPHNRVKAGRKHLSEEGMTPLHLAAMRGEMDILSCLLEVGKADPNCRAGANREVINQEGSTPLHWAVAEGYSECVNLLLEKNADPNLPDRAGNTPLHLAVIGGHLKVLDDLCQAGAKPDCVDNEGNTPLHLAVSKRRNDHVKRLLKAKANPHLSNKRGKTPLHIAKEKRYPDCVYELTQPISRR